MPIQSRGIQALTVMVRESGPDLAQSILHITLAFSAAGFEIKFVENDDGKTGANFRQNGEMPYSFIVNNADLLFYLRDVTADTVPDPQDFLVEAGQRAERKVRIRSLSEAEKLTGFLKPFLK